MRLPPPPLPLDEILATLLVSSNWVLFREKMIGNFSSSTQNLICIFYLKEKLYNIFLTKKKKKQYFRSTKFEKKNSKFHPKKELKCKILFCIFFT